MNVYEKLMKIQRELKAPKEQFNSFGKYSYRSCEDILEALKPLLYENNCVLIIRDEIQVIGERYYVRAIAVLMDIESGKEAFSTALAREEESKKGQDGSQVTGAASSYARKYALNGLFAIDDTKDADTQKPPEPKEKPEQDPNLVTPEQVKRMFSISNGNTMKVKEICLKYGYTSSKEIKKADYDKIIKDLEAV